MMKKKEPKRKFSRMTRMRIDSMLVPLSIEYQNRTTFRFRVFIYKLI